MERSSKLADLTLVSKYYPVANYSYPRNETMARYGAHATAPSDRSSLGSEGSAPGLVDDRTDSEVSADDDYQYRAMTAEIWDSFWRPGDEQEKEDKQPEIHPRKQYPALIPSPQRRKRSAQDINRRSQGWPLPDSPLHKPRGRQPAASYSPFPKPIALPPPGKPVVPSWQCSRAREPPRRPPRPDDRLLTPCIQQQPSPVTAVFASFPLPPDPRAANGPWSAPLLPERQSTASPEPRRPKTSLANRPPTPAEIQRPSTSHSCRPLAPAELRRPKSSRSLRPISPLEMFRPKASLANRPPTPFEPDTPSHIPDDADFPMPDISKHPAASHQRSRSRLTPEPEPRSFFEDDSDGDGDEDEGGRSFFRFHKRSASDLRRSARSAEPEAPRRHRGRTTPVPTSPTRQNPERKRGVDVFGRMLGRRSR
ncbi:hypothetical protein ACRE_065580 [Hapsidospora chrysogenum ATCC 11550]|uniref:Uncharacterized protein n=1 Tax=Hapsidospora chrysogenum (strain ATCC 11550 / CBS 779.69 / DSM 880 / IAM 14645 / JCM 23072 / IMI 49137) TaxID=857340 RepID=A0A086T035_HAPC1|nr:hypothetical protein ACRE_065580 [Hapsidospora chrysogenum ATCC 11550]